MKHIREFNGICHWWEDDLLIRSTGISIDLSTDNGQTFSPICSLDVGLLKSVFASTKLGSRLLRTNIKHCIKLHDDLLLVFATSGIFHVTISTREIKQVNTIQGSRPLKIAFDGTNLYYGEYRRNADRTPINIYKSADFGYSWNVCHTFTSIRHVHGIFIDPYTNSIWVTTGDYGDEAGIWKTDDKFESLEPVLLGGQQARVIDLLFTKDALFYGTDAPDEENWIYTLNRETHTVEKVIKTNGPVFHAKNTNHGMYFSTACEPSDFKSYTDSEITRLYNNKTEVVATRQKDLFSMRYFQYGQLLFPDGPGCTNQLVFTPYALKGDQRSVLVDMEHV